MLADVSASELHPPRVPCVTLLGVVSAVQINFLLLVCKFSDSFAGGRSFSLQSVAQFDSTHGSTREISRFLFPSCVSAAAVARPQISEVGLLGLQD
jgi:hypothetical protein